MSREYCEHCEYPKNVCICRFVTPIHNQLKVVVLQHPKETGHAKNTVRLASLCFANLEVIRLPKSLVIDAQGFTNAENEPTSSLGALLYPSGYSESINTFINKTSWAQDKGISIMPGAKEQSHFQSGLHRLYVLDGSWRQAYAIFKSNPWLAALPQVHLDDLPDKKYEIRKSKGEHQLSTIEAIAYAVEALEGRDTQAAINLLEAFSNQFQSFSKD